MDRFGPVLRRVERRLEAPEPQRSRILLEVAGDLEDLYRAYRKRGLDDAEARRKAAQWLAPSPAALESLGGVHLPGFERLLGRLGETARGRIEVALVAAASLAVVGAGVYPVLRAGVLPASSPGLWAVAALAAAGTAAAAAQGYALFVRGDRLGPGWERKLRRILAAAAGTALVGPLAGGLRLTLATPPPEAAGAAAALWSRVALASGVAAIGLSAALLLGLLWLLLRVRAGSVARARSELRETVGRLDGTEREDSSGR